MKTSDYFSNKINEIREEVFESIIELLKKLGGKVNLDYYYTECGATGYGTIEDNNDGYPVFAQFRFIELKGDNDFVVSASDWDDTCSFELSKEDLHGTYCIGLLEMLEEVKETADEEGQVVDSYDYD